MSRALRRHHEERIKKQVSKWVSWGDFFKNHSNPQKVIGFRAHTKANCSCYMCGNPRKYDDAKTLAEIVHIQIMKESIFGLDDF